MSTQTYLVELEHRDIGTMRDALDLAHAYIMLRRKLDQFFLKPTSRGPGPLRRQITKLQKDFPRFERYDPDPCYGIHNFVNDDDPFRDIVESLVGGGYEDVPGSLTHLIEKGEEALRNDKHPAHCTECGAELIHARRPEKEIA